MIQTHWWLNLFMCDLEWSYACSNMNMSQIHNSQTNSCHFIPMFDDQSTFLWLLNFILRCWNPTRRCCTCAVFFRSSQALALRAWERLGAERTGLLFDTFTDRFTDIFIMIDSYSYAQTPRFAHALLVLGRSTKVLGNIKVPPLLNFKFILQPLKILNKSLILPPPLNFKFILQPLKMLNKSLILPPPLNFYIHWRSSLRDQFSHPR